MEKVYKWDKKIIIFTSLSLLSVIVLLVLGIFCFAKWDSKEVGSVLLSGILSPLIFLVYSCFSINKIKIKIYQPRKINDFKGTKEFGKEDFFPKRKQIAQKLMEENYRMSNDRKRHKNSFAIYGGYGVGKSDFIERFVNLDYRGYTENEKHIFNAGLTDEFNDATTSMIRFLISNELLSKATIWKIMDINSNFNNNPFKTESSSLHKKFKDIDFLYDVKQLIEKDTKLRETKRIIIIDELDRAKPEFALNLLEATRYYFIDIPNITFIFTISLKHFKEIIKNHYGIDNCKEFLEKYIALSFDLNILNFNEYFNLNSRNKILSKPQYRILENNLPYIEFENLRQCETMADIIQANSHFYFNENGKFYEEMFEIVIPIWVRKILNKNDILDEGEKHKAVLNDSIIRQMESSIRNYDFTNLKKIIIENSFENELLSNLEDFKKRWKGLPDLNNRENFIKFDSELDLIGNKYKHLYKSKLVIEEGIVSGSHEFIYCRNILDMFESNILEKHEIFMEEFINHFSTSHKKIKNKTSTHEIYNSYLKTYIIKRIERLKQWTQP